MSSDVDNTCEIRQQTEGVPQLRFALHVVTHHHCNKMILQLCWSDPTLQVSQFMLLSTKVAKVNCFQAAVDFNCFHTPD